MAIWPGPRQCHAAEPAVGAAARCALSDERIAAQRLDAADAEWRRGAMCSPAHTASNARAATHALHAGRGHARRVQWPSGGCSACVRANSSSACRAAYCQWSDQVRRCFEMGMLSIKLEAACSRFALSGVPKSAVQISLAQRISEPRTSFAIQLSVLRNRGRVAVDTLTRTWHAAG